MFKGLTASWNNKNITMSEETEKIAIEFAKFIIDGEWVIRKDGTWFSRRFTEFQFLDNLY